MKEENSFKASAEKIETMVEHEDEEKNCEQNENVAHLTIVDRIDRRT